MNDGQGTVSSPHTCSAFLLVDRIRLNLLLHLRLLLTQRQMTGWDMQVMPSSPFPFTFFLLSQADQTYQSWLNILNIQVFMANVRVNVSNRRVARRPLIGGLGGLETSCRSTR